MAVRISRPTLKLLYACQEPKRFSELREILKVSKVTLYEHLKKLQSLGYLEKTSEGHYILTKEGRKALAELEAIEIARDIVELSGEKGVNRIRQIRARIALERFVEALLYVEYLAKSVPEIEAMGDIGIIEDTIRLLEERFDLNIEEHRKKVRGEKIIIDVKHQFIEKQLKEKKVLIAVPSSTSVRLDVEKIVVNVRSLLQRTKIEYIEDLLREDEKEDFREILLETLDAVENLLKRAEEWLEKKEARKNK